MFVLPGETISESGTKSSLAGFVFPDNMTKTKTKTKQTPKTKTVEVHHWRNKDRVICVNDIIIGQITRIKLQFAECQIICIQNDSLLNCIRGQISARNVRKLDIDNVQMWKCFRPMDIIKAQVISLGTQYHPNVYLSTAQSQFGVISAMSSFGFPLIPIAWNKMQCSNTKIIEQRKVAKIDDDDNMQKQKQKHTKTKTKTNKHQKRKRVRSHKKKNNS